MGKVGRPLDEGCNHFRIFYLMMDWIILSKCPALRIAGPFVLCDVVLPCGIVHFLRLLCQELAQNCCHFLHSLFLCRICAIFFVLVYAPCTRTAPVFFDCPASFVQLVKFNPPNLCSSSCGFLRRPHVWTILFFTFLPGFWIILYRPASNIQAPPAAFPQNSPLRFAHKTQGAGIFLISSV